jgi:hypothetical protein
MDEATRQRSTSSGFASSDHSSSHISTKCVPDVKKYISDTIDYPETMYYPEIWEAPGFALVLSWLAQRWHRKCLKLVPGGSRNPQQYLTKEQQEAYLDSAATELIREIKQRRPLN